MCLLAKEVGRKPSWVRIPPSPPSPGRSFSEVWLRLWLRRDAVRLNKKTGLFVTESSLSHELCSAYIEYIGEMDEWFKSTVY